ncbi:LysR family transcriptional regulator [Reyranella sp. MMS21-HV4-11]|jgi:aminoethylphosphonate catabolism LysR family transcriptional regulator|uniref:LysR family transcriptional regulator n=1 Tax=Reyranella humidisoli TaxID=2849149 RepID=A0ABS6ID28_9HYPH|nr:LysR substrate-binding domain-containing protein [Reyranella sp. MMS21-HV4-11]MBU8872226.1 LysR family transcriptional regulator [Reyranella sp. MMS21-HV4-11]
MRHTQLRSFHAVAQRLSFTAAARELGVSQPTITTQVKSLEQEFGVELFVRRGRRIELTETGGGLLDITRRLFADEKEAADYLNETRGLKTGHLRVGAVGPYHVTDMLAAFNARHPGLYVSVTVGNSRDTLRDLLDYRTDVAVLAHVDPDPRLVAIPYRRHRVVAFCHIDHPFAQRRGIRVRDMEGQRLILREAGSTTRRAFDQAMREAHVRPQVVMEIGSRESIREAVAKGIGMGVVSEAEFIPDPRIRPLPITDAEVYTYAHVVHLKERQNARLVRAFLQVLAGLLPVSSPSSRRRPSDSRR